MKTETIQNAATGEYEYQATITSDQWIRPFPRSLLYAKAHLALRTDQMALSMAGQPGFPLVHRTGAFRSHWKSVHHCWQGN